MRETHTETERLRHRETAVKRRSERDGEAERGIKSDRERLYKGRRKEGRKEKKLERQVNNQQLSGVGGGEGKQWQGQEGKETEVRVREEKDAGRGERRRVSIQAGPSLGSAHQAGGPHAQCPLLHLSVHRSCPQSSTPSGWQVSLAPPAHLAP